MNQPTGNSTMTLNTFDDHQYHEIDLVNIAHLGRQWFGESFDINQEQEFEFNFPNFEASSPIKVMATLASAAFAPTSFKVSANGQEIGNINFPALNTNSDTEFNTGSLTKQCLFYWFRKCKN